MAQGENTTIIGWNVLFKAPPAAQYEHIQTLEERARKNGAAAVLFCLSELKVPMEPSIEVPITLWDILDADGYFVNSNPTSRFRHENAYEGIAFASRDLSLAGSVTDAKFAPTIVHRTHPLSLDNYRHIHWDLHREVGSLDTPDGMDVYTAHASYYAPKVKERAAIRRAVGPAIGAKMLVGDLNTTVNQRIINELTTDGWIKLRDPKQRVTFPVSGGIAGRIPVLRRGLELDHALVTPELEGQSSMEIADCGPSDHHPLVVTVEKS